MDQRFETDRFDKCLDLMASHIDSDDTSSSDSVFYDAHSSQSDEDLEIPLQHEPRWRVPSNQESTKPPERFCAISLTKDQIQDIERRSKLRRLRAQESNDLHSQYEKLKSRTLPKPSTSTLRNESIGENTCSTPDLIKDHIDNDHSSRKQQTVPTPRSKLSGNDSDEFPDGFGLQGRSLPYSTLPSVLSMGFSAKDRSRMKQVVSMSEPNILDLNLIDRITRFGELIPNSQKLNDEEILQQPIVRDLDNGKYIPLCDANPMTETIMKRANGSGANLMIPRHNSVLKNHHSTKNIPEHSHATNDSNDNSFRSTQKKINLNDGDGSSSSESSSTRSTYTTGVSSSSATSKSLKSIGKSKTSFFQGSKKQLTKLVVNNFLRRGTKKTNGDHTETIEGEDDDEEAERIPINDGSNGDLKYKASRTFKEQAQFDKTQLLQTIVNAHDGPIWCMKFSPDGHLLATGGQDNLLKVWVLRVAKDYFANFSRQTNGASQQQNEILSQKFQQYYNTISTEMSTSTVNSKLGLNETQSPMFPKAFSVLTGHQAPVLDVAWSKSLFLLSSSMDKTVRLWHLSRSECLCFFRHVDFVSAIAFYPRDDRFFVSASLDGHVRVWNIPDKRVMYSTSIPTQISSQITAAQANLITAINFCNDGRNINVGTFDGRVIIYSNSLKYDTVMNIGDHDGSHGHRSRKKRRKPCKITGIEPMNTDSSKVLITSNDSRIRLHNIRNKEIEHKYRGYSNQSSQIRASFSSDDQYIISGSEDSWIYIWKTKPNANTKTDGSHASSSETGKLTRKQGRHFDRAFERIRVHNTIVTCAIFAPNSSAIMNHLYQSNDSSSSLFRNNIPTRSSSGVNISQMNNNRTTRPPSYPSNSNSTDGSQLNNSIYVMMTADSKGQLKMLVNRFHRLV